MAVGFDVASESHTGTTGNASTASFTWNHGGGVSARGALVFVFAISATNPVTGVTYGGVAMNAVPYTGTDTDTEPGTVKAYYLDGVEPGTQAVVVSRTNNATVMYAVCYTVTATRFTEVYNAGVRTAGGSTIQTAASASNTGTGSPVAVTVDDGSPGTNSLRFMGQYYGGSSVTAAATGSTAGPSIDFGLYVIQTYRETTAGQGARSVGTSSTTADDRAFVAVAVRETGSDFPTGTSAATFKFSEAATGDSSYTPPAVTGTSAATFKAQPQSFGAHAVAGTYEREVIADLPLGYWPLKDTLSGNGNGNAIADYIGNRTTPTFSNVYDNTPYPDDHAGALRTDGDSILWGDGANFQYVNIPNAAHLNLGDGPFSIEFWFKKTNYTGSAREMMIFNTGLFTGAPHILLRSNDDLDFDAYGIGNAIDGPNFTANYGVHHVVVTHTSTTSQMYVDGVSVGTATDRSMVSTTDPIHIGAKDGNGWDTFVGQLSDIAIYNTVLSGTRVLAHYAAGNDVTGTSATTFKASTASTGDSNFYPTVVGSAEYGSGSSWGTSHVIPLPTGYQAGDLLLLAISNNNTGTITDPSGWTQLVSYNTAFASKVWWKRATGNEGTSVTVTTPAMYAAGMSYALRNCSNPEYSSLAFSSVYMQTLSPSWGVAANMYVGIGFNVPNGGVESTAYTSMYPSGFTFRGSPWGGGCRGVYGDLAKYGNYTQSGVNGGENANSIGYNIVVRYIQTGVAATTFKFAPAATGTSVSEITGTAASSFKYSAAATGAETMAGTAASSFKFSEAATGAETLTGTAASTWKFSHAATGAEALTGAAASTWKFSAAATGVNAQPVTGTSAATFKYSAAATGAETITGASAATWKFSAAATGTERFTGTAASTWKFSEAAAGAESMSGASAATWKFSAAATGTERISGTSAATFKYSTAATGTEVVSGSAATTWRFSGAGTGAETITGAGASTWRFSHEATGTSLTGTTGLGASTFPFSAAATGSVSPAGVAASTFGFSHEATGVQTTSISGTVTADGVPVVGAIIYIFLHSDGTTYVNNVTTTTGGVYSITLPMNVYRLWVQTNTAGYPDQAYGALDWVNGTGVDLTTGNKIADVPLIPQPVTGTSAATFGYSAAAAGINLAPITGTSASAWTFSAAAAGINAEPVTGTGASTWTFSHAATGSQTAQEIEGTSATAFGFTSEATGEETISGASAATFGHTTAATGATFIPVTGTAASGAWKFSGAATGAEGMGGAAASTWSFRPFSTGLSAEPITGSSATNFGFAPYTAGYMQIVFIGTAASGAWKFGVATTGAMLPSGVAATTFPFDHDAAGYTDVTGSGASEWKFSDNGIGLTAASGAVIGESHLTTFDWTTEVVKVTGAEGNVAQRSADTTWVSIA